ncbi:hypothetical protein CAPTEDRAFT_196516 [Capitella teleta]|uniref:Gamma-aminobutyric acid type B receptor subunit 2 n=1 Tax=Capitella teleta TaxID=283909 RepID=R7VAQ6_CAPTE|nr:hypothetical protein CAPTEDRAFT_196516 [Capitella teleta]|eukprot:ELU13426.1 hypothetical protein CAPTEDRAFT_196516 [Capitella teleta]
MYDLLYEDPPKVMVLGGGCSIVCQPCSEGSTLWNLTTVSYGCMSPSLSNRDRFPHFFRTVQPEVTQNPARIELMRLFEWDRVAIIQQSYEYFTTQMDDLIERLNMSNTTIITNEIFQTDASIQVKNLKKHDARIIVTASYADEMSEMICKAYAEGLYGPGVQWIFANWLEEFWWRTSPHCSPEEFLEVIDGAIYTGMSYENPILEKSVGGINTEEFKLIFDQRSNYSALYAENFGPAAYDSIWTAALALNQTVDKMAAMDFNKTLDEFTYIDKAINDLIIETLYELEFVGVRGYTRFDKTGNPQGLITISQQQGENLRMVGLYHPEIRGIPEYLEWINGGLVWKGGRPPRSGSSLIISQLRLSLPLYATMSTLAALGILVAMGLLFFNTWFRKRKVIKMSSPNINNLILLGCCLCYFTIVFESDNIEVERYLCVLRQFSFVGGFALTFGALFSKTWRVHIVMIASTKTAKPKIIKDHQLAFGVFILLFVDVSILVAWQGVDPIEARLRNATEQVSVNDPDVIIKYQAIECKSEYQTHFSAALLALQGLLLIFGAFLAWETRKVKVEALNDSKYIGLCIYNVVVLTVMGVAVQYVSNDAINVSYGFTSGLILLGTTLTQTIIFGPKVWSVRYEAEAVGPLTMPSTSMSVACVSTEQRHLY